MMILDPIVQPIDPSIWNLDLPGTSSLFDVADHRWIFVEQMKGK
jgi:hypothetical protein